MSFETAAKSIGDAFTYAGSQIYAGASWAATNIAAGASWTASNVAAGAKWVGSSVVSAAGKSGAWIGHSWTAYVVPNAKAFGAWAATGTGAGVLAIGSGLLIFTITKINSLQPKLVYETDADGKPIEKDGAFVVKFEKDSEGKLILKNGQPVPVVNDNNGKWRTLLEYAALIACIAGGAFLIVGSAPASSAFAAVALV